MSEKISRKKLMLGIILFLTESCDSKRLHHRSADFVHHVDTPTEVPDLEGYVDNIAHTLPVWDDLAARKTGMKELNPKLQSIEHELDSLGDMTDMEAAKIGGETIKAVNNVVDTPFIGQETKEYVVDRIRMQGNTDLESLYDRKIAEANIDAIPAAISMQAGGLSHFEQNLTPNPHTYLDPYHLNGMSYPVPAPVPTPERYFANGSTTLYHQADGSPFTASSTNQVRTPVSIQGAPFMAEKEAQPTEASPVAAAPQANPALAESFLPLAAPASDPVPVTAPQAPQAAPQAPKIDIPASSPIPPITAAPPSATITASQSPSPSSIPGPVVAAITPGSSPVQMLGTKESEKKEEKTNQEKLEVETVKQEKSEETKEEKKVVYNEQTKQVEYKTVIVPIANLKDQSGTYVSQNVIQPGTTTDALHDKAGEMGHQLNAFKSETDKVMDSYLEEKYKDKKEPNVEVEYTKGPTIFKMPSKELAGEDDIAKRIREGVEKLETEADQKSEAKFQREKGIIKEAMQNYAA